MNYREARELLLANSVEQAAPYEWLEEPCRVWSGSQDYRYGYLWYDGARYWVHRLSFVAFNERDIAKGKQINHHCDVRMCLESTHLYEGTQHNNLEDMWERGRAVINSAVLSDEQVREIKVLGIENKLSGYQVAEQYNVTNTTIYSIWNCHNRADVASELNEQLLHRRRMNKVNPIRVPKYSRDDKIAELMDQGLRLTEIAAKVDANPIVVGWVVRRIREHREQQRKAKSMQFTRRV